MGPGLLRNNWFILYETIYSILNFIKLLDKLETHFGKPVQAGGVLFPYLDLQT